MTIRASIEGEICYLFVSGPLALLEFTNAWMDVMHSPRFFPPMKAIIDVRAMDRSIPVDEIKAMVKFCNRHKTKFARRCAIVCEQGTLAYGLVRMFCAFAEGHCLLFPIFSDLDQACDWVLQRTAPIAA